MVGKTQQCQLVKISMCHSFLNILSNAKSKTCISIGQCLPPSNSHVSSQSATPKYALKHQIYASTSTTIKIHLLRIKIQPIKHTMPNRNKI